MIYSTSQVKVFFDDLEEIQDAYMEAENNAIVQISRFLQTDVKYNKKYFLLIFCYKLQNCKYHYYLVNMSHHRQR